MAKSGDEPEPATGPFTLAVDCGGTGLKATVLDATGHMVSRRVRVKTPYPCPPDVLVHALAEIAEETGVHFDRASVGFPGLIREGIVRATPHYVTEAGPFTPRRDDLVVAWTSFDVQSALEKALAVPTRVLNDAEIAGLAVIERSGFEMMFTLGTGFGCAMFSNGRLLPKIELSQARWRSRNTFDDRLGHHTRTRIGDDEWSGRVRQALSDLRPVFWWDHVYVGGGGAKHLTIDLGPDVTIVPNEMGLVGGVRLWENGPLR